MASVEAWSAIMQSAQNAAQEPEMQPMRDGNKFIALFFVLFMVSADRTLMRTLFLSCPDFL